VAALVVGAGLFGLSRRARVGSQTGGVAEQEGGSRWRGFAAGTPGVPGADGEGVEPGAAAPGVAAPSPVSQEQVDTAMSAWRTAVLNKDADTVLALDRAFTELPGPYRAALIKSAETDDNERVRAFSTRVLGKLRTPALVGVFAPLLDDKSPYVRQNAAWALGEMGARPDGREAARRTVAELQRLGQHDAAKDVRLAASNALNRLH
jgi:hypothetical protein